MIIRFREIGFVWRVLTLGYLSKYQADVYSVTDEEVNSLIEWLKFQGIKYTSNRHAYYSADNMYQAEQYKPKITISIRSEENMAALKLTWC